MTICPMFTSFERKFQKLDDHLNPCWNEGVIAVQIAAVDARVIRRGYVLRLFLDVKNSPAILVPGEIKRSWKMSFLEDLQRSTWV